MCQEGISRKVISMQLSAFRLFIWWLMTDSWKLFCIKTYALNAFCTGSYPRRDAIYRNSCIVEIRSKVPHGCLSLFLPLSSGYPGVMGVLPSGMGFFIANIASVSHNPKIKCQNSNVKSMTKFKFYFIFEFYLSFVIWNLSFQSLYYTIPCSPTSITRLNFLAS